MDKKEFEAKQFTDFKDQFQWFLGGALFLLVFDILLLERRTAWLKKLNLFNEKQIHISIVNKNLLCLLVLHLREFFWSIASAGGQREIERD